MSIPSSSKDDPRLPHLHESALSPTEYSSYLKWRKAIAASPSGVDGLLDEQDALAWIRKECGVGRLDEAKILSLFDRYPLGLEAGHFFALLRLTSWAQQGSQPTKALVFTQTSPPVIGLKENTSFPLPTTVSVAAIRPTLPPPQHPATAGDAPLTRKPSLPSSKVPLPAAQAQTQPLPPPTLATPARPSAASVLAPPVPPESSKPARSPGPSNPFRDSVAATGGHSRSASLNVGESLQGFDPAPNPFKQTKPKLVKPTPIVATPGLPNPVSSAAEPSRAATAGLPGTSGFSTRSMKSIDDVLSPPLPPRPTMGGFDKPPPPLPPRAHISPLIQAGLDASLQVRKQKDALPPKTFTVLHSSNARAKASEPRLLTGESAPLSLLEETAPSPHHLAKRRVSGQESRKSISETVVGGGMPTLARQNSDESAEPQRAATSRATVIAAPKPSRPGASRRHHHHHQEDRRASGSASAQSSQQPGRVAAPKAQYANGSESIRTKPTLPSWLREQEELQRSALIEGRPLSPPPADSIPDDSEERARELERSRRAPTVLDDEYDVYPTELSEQASRAASIDRPHNPFIHRSSQAEAEKLKVQPLLKHHRSLAKAPHSPELHKPLARSKTLHAKGAPPPPPPLASQAAQRKRLESLPATLDSGTYAGFRHPASGGLRLVPPSAKADVGINALKRDAAERRGDSSALSVSSSSGAPPMSPRGDEESGETSVNSTNPTSVQGLASSLERKLSGRSDGASTSLKSRVSDFLKLQDGPPKGQRPIDDLKRDAIRLAERRGWINRSADGGEGLLEDVDEVPAQGEDGEEGEESPERWDDAPTPDDDNAYGAGESNTTTRGIIRDATPTAGDARSILGKGTPPPPPRRSATMSAAPIARRPSGFVARRASKLEEHSQPLYQTTSLGRASSFSGKHAGRAHAAGEGSGTNKRSSWIEAFEADRRRRAEGGGDEVEEEEEEEEEERKDGETGREVRGQELEGWRRLD